jgi:hypothetical protein
MHFKGVCGFVDPIQSPAVAVRLGKHPMVLLHVDGLDEIRVEPDDGNSVD